MAAPSFFSELKRRQIYRGGVMYVVAGWVIVQVATTVFPYFDIPGWAIRLVVVAILLGFPIALVALWMFESTLPNDPETRLHDRRLGGREASDVMAKLMETERAERQKETEGLIAALAQLKGQGAGTDAPQVAVAAQRALPAAAPVAAARPAQRRRPVMRLAALLALGIVLSGIWMLVVPGAALQPAAASEHLAQKYVAPGFQQLEDVGVWMLTPLLHKLGIPLSPDRVFTILLVIAGYLVVRSFYRQMVGARVRRGRQPSG